MYCILCPVRIDITYRRPAIVVSHLDIINAGTLTYKVKAELREMGLPIK